MLQSLRNLIGTKLQIGETEGELRDAFFRLEDGMLRYIALDIGGWLISDNVIVSTDLLSPPEEEGDTRWKVALDEQALQKAPRWTMTDQEERLSLVGWPPVIVGPFGSTVSPILLYEQARDLQGGNASNTDDSAEPVVRNLQRAGMWLGLPVFDSNGEVGRLHDLDFESESGRILALVMEAPGPIPKRGAEIPYAALRHVADQETHLVLKETAAAASDDAPRVP